MRARVFVWKNACAQESEGVFLGLFERVSASLYACMCERVSVCVVSGVLVSNFFVEHSRTKFSG